MVRIQVQSRPSQDASSVARWPFGIVRFEARRARLLLAALLVVGALLPSAAAQETRIRAAMAGSPPTLDFVCSFASQARDYGVYIYESLVTLAQDYDVAPQLAERWEVSADNRTFTFFLRSGARFHDNTLVTADDVLVSFERFLEVSPRRADFGAVESMRAIDDATFEIVLSEASAAFLPLLAYPGPAIAVMPADVIRGKACGELDADSIIGTGPYKLVEWIPDQHVHLQRFDGYVTVDEPGSGYAGQRSANVRDLFFVPVPEAAARLAGLETGEYDYAQNLPADSYGRLSANPDIETHIIKPSFWVAIHLNTQNGLLQNPLLRRAIQVGLDQEEIMLVAAGGAQLMRLDCSIFFSEQTWHSDVCADRYNEYDVAEARRLMTEAGYANEPIRILTASDFQYMYLAAIALESQLSQLGFATELQVFTYSAMIDVFRNRRDDWDISYNGFSIRTDPGVFATVFTSTSGYQPYENPEVDRLWAVGRETFDPADRYAVYERIQDHIYDDVPVIKHGDIFTMDGARSRVQGFEVFYTTPRFWNVRLSDR